MQLLVETKAGVVSVEPRTPTTEETCWVHLVNPDATVVSNILGDIFGLHPLVVEDVHHLGQRPKVDLYQHWNRAHALISFYTLAPNLRSVELSLVIGANFFVSVSQVPVPWLEELYRRAEASAFSFANPTEILYRILDGAVDSFTEQMNELEETLDRMERRVFRHPDVEIASTVFHLKHRLHELRKIAVDEQSTLAGMKAETFPFVDVHFEAYFHDVMDHIARAIGNIELVRDRLGTLLDFQANQRAAKLNDVMKTLAIISTIFLPLSFIVGLYGMNFHDIPELSWKYGYVYVWLLLISVATFFIVYFKRKRWW